MNTADLMCQQELKYIVKKYSVSKESVANSFGRAVGSYLDASQYQRDVGKRVLGCVYQHVRDAQNILDLGSGLDYCARKLNDDFPLAQIVSLDISEQMLLAAKTNVSRKSDLPVSRHWICGDMESLPFSDGAFDLLVSNLALQWATDVRTAFQNLHAVVKKDGTFIFSTLLEGTLHELKYAWSKVDGYIHVNHFHQEDEIKNYLRDANFLLKESFAFNTTLSFESLGDLMRSLKRIGATNLNAGRHHGLTGKGSMQKLEAGYPKTSDSDFYPLTYRAGIFVCRVE